MADAAIPEAVPHCPTIAVLGSECAPGRIRRRMALRGAAGGLGLAAAAVLLAGCAPPVPAGTGPAARHGVQTLTYAPWGQWTSISNWQQYMQPVLHRFEQAHPGVRVNPVAPTTGQYPAAIVAGSAPDVFSEYEIVPLLEGGLTMNLRPLLGRDNIPLTTWSPLQMDAFTTSRGIFFLPTYMNCGVYAINLGDLDARGLAYPDPGWTLAEAESLFRAATWQSAGKPHFGVAPSFNGQTLHPFADNPLPNNHFAVEIFGGAVMDGAQTGCTMADPRVVQAVQWWEALYWAGVAAPAGSPRTFPYVTFVETASNGILNQAKTWLNKYKWTYFPVPGYPAGRKAWGGVQGHAISLGTKYPEAAWTLLKFLDVDPWHQRYVMKLLLRPPSILALWSEFTQTLETVIPGLKGKGLQWFAESAAHWSTPGRIFKYQPITAATMIDATMAGVYARKVGVATAMRSVSQQVDALETAGAAALPPTYGLQLIKAHQQDLSRINQMFAAAVDGHRSTDPQVARP